MENFHENERIYIERIPKDTKRYLQMFSNEICTQKKSTKIQQLSIENIEMIYECHEIDCIPFESSLADKIRQANVLIIILTCGHIGVNPFVDNEAETPFRSHTYSESKLHIEKII